MYIGVVLYLTVANVVLSQSLSHSASNQENKTSLVYRTKYRPSSLRHDSADLTTPHTEIIHQIKATEEKTKQTRNEYSKSLASFEESRDAVLTLDELRQRCQHFSKLFESTKDGDTPTEHKVNISPGSSTLRPVYIRNKPTFIQKNNGFYVTAQPIGMKKDSGTIQKFQKTTERPYTESTSTSKSQSTSPWISNTTPTPISSTTTGSTASPTPFTKMKIKYTRLEPVILQKTVLTDGRILYHWHKALPTTPFDVPLQDGTASIQPEPAPLEFPAFITPNKVSHETTTEHSTASTTTAKSSWYFGPFGSLFGSSANEETTTEERSVSTTSASTSTSTTSTTTVSPLYSSTNSEAAATSTSTDQVQLEHQLKFVVPVHYDDIDHELNPQNKLWNLNRFAHYPKDLQPANVMPQPSFPLIKSLVVPKYSLGYNNGGYGLYGAGYENYQRYTPREQDLENVSL